MYSYSKMSLTIDLSLLWNYMKIFYDKYLGSLKLLFPELSPKLILQSILCIFKKLSFVAELTFLNEVNFQHNVSWKFGDPYIFTFCIAWKMWKFGREKSKFSDFWPTLRKCLHWYFPLPSRESHVQKLLLTYFRLVVVASLFLRSLFSVV